jgi:hypothetical protein
MADAQNGARIKAWAGSDVGQGIVRNITYENFVNSNVDLPITIDQVLSLKPRKRITKYSLMDHDSAT